MPLSNTILSSDGKTSTSTTAGSSTGSYTIPRTLFSRLLKQNRTKLVLRALAAIIVGPSGVPGSSVDMTIQLRDTMGVYRLGPGSEIPFDAEKYSGFNVKPIKYGVRVDIPKEFEEDSNWGMLQLNTDTAAYQIADNEESLIISTLDTGSGETGGTRVANSNASLGPSDIIAGFKGIREENYNPTHLLIGAECESDLYLVDTFIEADKIGISDPSKRLIGKIYGMKVIMSNNISAKYAYVLDKQHAFMLVEKRPVTIEKYKAPERDSRGFVATQRIAARYIHPGAISRIITV